MPLTRAVLTLRILGNADGNPEHIRGSDRLAIEEVEDIQ